MANDPPNISSSSPAPIPPAAGSIVSTDAGDISSPTLTVSTPVREETENTEVRDESTPIGLGHADTPCTSKSMEGAAARDTFTKMKEEGMTIAVHWQDADSTTEKEVQKNFVDVIKLCGGLYTHAHYNQLKKIKGQKSFGLVDQSKYKDEFPEVLQGHNIRQGVGVL